MRDGPYDYLTMLLWVLLVAAIVWTGLAIAVAIYGV